MADSSFVIRHSSSGLRLGLLGLGERGQALAAAVNELPGVALVAGTAGDEAAAGAVRGTWWGYATAEELVAAPDVDAVLVALHDADRASGYAREALEREKAVLWPGFSGDLERFDDLCAVAGRRGAALSLPNELRYLPAATALRESVLRGEPGPLLGVFAAWRTRRALPGGALRELGLPLLDYLRWCLPAELERVERVQVTAAPLFGEDRPVALLILRAGGGLVCTVELAASLPAAEEQQDEVTIEVLGESAALRADPYNQAITVVGPAGRSRVAWHRAAAYPLVEEFVAALREGGVPPGPPAELRPTLLLLEELGAATASGEARPVA